tara:strand:- start:37 stop:429 length:393 start_codon:yes stop_codon:yes gene_type:complete
MFYLMIFLISLILFLSIALHSKIIKTVESKNLYFSFSTLFFSHLLQVFLFAFLYFVFIKFFGSELIFVDGSNYSLINLTYFSANVYTTLGMGDIVPSGMLKIIVTVESIFGLMMIAFSASAVFNKIVNSS